MGQTLVRSYDRFSDAQHAREALLSSGFAPDSVHLESTGDEAGPVEGNAVVDTKDEGTGPGSTPGPFIMSREERTDAYNNSEPVWRGAFVLTVDASDDRQCSIASDILDRHGAADPEARIPPRIPPRVPPRGRP